MNHTLKTMYINMGELRQMGKHEEANKIQEEAEKLEGLETVTPQNKSFTEKEKTLSSIQERLDKQKQNGGNL